ncbi:hypothetical protein HOY80DRAFT_1000373 [Tuber brumale]|nr:hypothetical protein HOY80DRAFT_1000373 [Tuber brumale]
MPSTSPPGMNSKKSSPQLQSMFKILIVLIGHMLAFLHKLMGQRLDRYQYASSSAPVVTYITFCTQALGKSRIRARQNIARMPDLIYGPVTQPNGMVRIVNLEKATCSSRNRQENGISCGHAPTCIMSVHLYFNSMSQYKTL